jgi:hypothetical protein
VSGSLKEGGNKPEYRHPLNENMRLLGCLVLQGHWNKTLEARS